MSKRNGLANPIRLKPFDSEDPEEHIFELKRVLPAGMTFPYDFGFVPSTKADDGDPVNVGKEYLMVGVKGPDQARKLVKSGMR